LGRKLDFPCGAGPFASKLDASQFALRANLVANQFESGLAHADRENRLIEQGFLRRKRLRRPEQEEK